MLIKAVKLTKIYGSGESQVVALKKADLEIAQGEFVSIMGPSGSGKSTLLHLLSGLDRPTSGSLSYDGQDIYGLKDKELSAFRRRRIGFIFQQFNLLPVLTARENILMPLLLDKKNLSGRFRRTEALPEQQSAEASMAALPEQQSAEVSMEALSEQQSAEAYLEELAELLGIKDRLTHLPHELSGGQQQRVAIARALIARPDIIFADEPTGNLDSKSGGEVMRLLEEIRQKMEKTLVVITHDSRIAQRAERRLEIIDGILKQRDFMEE